MTEYPAVIHLKACRPTPAEKGDAALDIEDSSSSNPTFEALESNKEMDNCKIDDEDGKLLKRASVDDAGEMYQSIKKLITSFDKEVNKRLENIEQRLDSVTNSYDVLEEKVDQLSSIVKDTTVPYFLSAAASPSSVSSEDSCGTSVPVGSNITLITLNTEADYPNGSWLGDESNPEMRVRCRISPTELLHINTTCSTPEKMALTLLDYLFDRETQACSNISGTGKHKKKQLDPLLVYGIRCHLINKFGISAPDWNKIRQNLDSKCRTAFRRKIKGLPLIPKGGHPAHRQHSNEETVTLNNMEGVMSSFTVPITPDSVLTNISTDEEIPESSLTLQSVDAAVDQSVLEKVIREAQLIRTEHGDIQVLHATPEQIAQIQQTHQIQFLTGGHILATPVEEFDEQSASLSNDAVDDKENA